MRYSKTLAGLLFISMLFFCKFTLATNYTDTGTSTTYSLNTGDSLFIAQGTFTGIIASLDSGAVITVDADATFYPALFDQSAYGTLTNYGNFFFSQQFITSTGFTLNNYGVMSLDSTVKINNYDQVWTNNIGATMQFSGHLYLNNGQTDHLNNIINMGSFTVDSNFYMSAKTSLANYKDILVNGRFWMNGGTLTNYGKFETIDSLVINANTAVIHNYCRMITSGGFRNNSNLFYNYSYIWARNDLGKGGLSNYGQIYNVPIGAAIPMLHGRDFTNQGNALITGNGNLYFYGVTTQKGSSISGASAPTQDTLRMYDVTRTSPSTVYDVQGGNMVYPNTIYEAWGVPDSTREYVWNCGLLILLQVPLALEWNYFDVNLYGDVPALNWSAAFENQAVFDIQRSYDGNNFYSIELMPAASGQQEYRYDDRKVNTRVPIVYYRIRAIQSDGREKITQIRVVRFGNKIGNIYTYPNPFKGNFTISYTAPEGGPIVIRLFNVNGQEILTRKAEVTEGYNLVNIHEASQFADGIYVLQILKENEMIYSGKILKQ